MGHRIDQTILKKKTNVEELISPNFKIYYKDAVIKIVWNRYKDRHRAQWKQN